jgi:hypothetical protein
MAVQRTTIEWETIMRRVLAKIVIRQAIIWMLVTTTVAMGIRPPAAIAMVAPALSPVAESPSGSHRLEDLQKIQRVLESKVVRQRLIDLGLTPEEVNAKLVGLSDEQFHQFATMIDAIIPAGDGLGIVIALLVIAILAVILVYLLNHRIVITKNGS